MPTARGYHTSSILTDGRVLVIGGYNTSTGPQGPSLLYDGATNISTALTYGGTWLDLSSSYPRLTLNRQDLLDEVNRAIAANGWTTNEDTYFQIYTPSGISSFVDGACGVPWPGNPAIGHVLYPQFGCFPVGPYPNGSTVDAAINASAHVIMATVTNPGGDGWYDGAETIAGKCAFDFGPRAADGSNVTLAGRPYIIQKQWSNAASGCVLSHTASPPTIDVHPSNQTVSYGGAVTLNAAASGVQPLSYQWFAGPSGNTSSPVGTDSTAFTTPSLISNTRYWVRVTNAGGSTNSNAALVGVQFTDATLSAGASLIKATHILQLRARIDALRARSSLAAYSYSSGTISAGANTIRVADLLEMRQALADVYLARGLQPPNYTNSLTAGVPIRSVDIAELRAAVIAIE